MSVINRMLLALDARQQPVAQTQLPDLIQPVQPHPQTQPRYRVLFALLLLTALLAGFYFLIPFFPAHSRVSHESSQMDEVFRIAPPAAITSSTTQSLQLQTSTSLQATSGNSGNLHQTSPAPASDTEPDQYLVRARNDTP